MSCVSTQSERLPYVSLFLNLRIAPPLLTSSSLYRITPQDTHQLPMQDISEVDHMLMQSFTGRCDVQGQLRPPWCAHGNGPNRSRSVQQIHDLQPKEPGLAKPRPIRSFVSFIPTSLVPETIAQAEELEMVRDMASACEDRFPHAEIQSCAFASGKLQSPVIVI